MSMSFVMKLNCYILCYSLFSNHVIGITLFRSPNPCTRGRGLEPNLCHQVRRETFPPLYYSRHKEFTRCGHFEKKEQGYTARSALLTKSVPCLCIRSALLPRLKIAAFHFLKISKDSLKPFQS